MTEGKENSSYIGAARELQKEIVLWRRDLHRIPELGFQLHRTSSYVRSRLEEMGLSYRTAAETGIVVLIEGKGRGPTLAFRADMDALPVREETGLPFASTNNNMHACGHDAHTAMLLGTAKLLSKYRSRLQGNVKLLFQPGEEGYGGAARMIADGCLEDPPVDAAIGLHVGQIFPEVGLGQIGICEGPILAASTAFEVLVKGSSTHGALPHLGVDAITTAAEMILALQKIVSRETNPLNPVVLTVGQISGGEALNIISSRVTFSGDFRTMEESDRSFVTARLQEVCSAIATANRAEAEVKILGGYPPTINDPEYVKRVITAAARVVGKDNIITVKKPSMGTEDMAYYFDKVPGAFFILGTGNPARGIVHPHHNPRFDLDESVLWMGPAVLTGLALDYPGMAEE